MRKQAAATAVIAAAVAVGGQLVTAGAAQADSHPYVVSGTDGDGLYLHTGGPGIHTATAYVMPEGAEFDVSCFELSDSVAGDTAWLYGTDSTTGTQGWAADYYINTPVTQGNEAQQLPTLGIAACGSPGAVTNSTVVTQSGATPRTFTYDRNEAAAWAEAHALDPQGYGSECTWFVSQALWAGGFPTDDTWSNIGSNSKYGGTYTAWNVQPLLDYLTSHYSVTQQDITGDLTTNAVPGAEVGDIIGYDWSGTGAIDHLAIIVGFASNDYPVVAEMGQFNFDTHPWYKIDNPSSDYVSRGWTWSEINNTWLQNESGQANMRAYLFHFSDTPQPITGTY